MPEPVCVTTPYSYSAAGAIGDYVFLGLHRGEGGTFLEQLQGTFTGASEALGRCGLPLTSFVRITVRLRQIDDLPAKEKLVLDCFPAGRYPARMTVVPPSVDTGCLVMIEGTACRGA